MILFCEYVYFTFCFYVFDMSSVVSYFTVFMILCCLVGVINDDDDDDDDL